MEYVGNNIKQRKNQKLPFYKEIYNYNLIF